MEQPPATSEEDIAVTLKKTFRKPIIVTGIQLVLYIILIATTISYGMFTIPPWVTTTILTFIWIFFLISESLQMNDLINNKNDD